MNIKDYLFTQTTLNQALHTTPPNKAGFALFAAIFSDQIDTLREHIEPDQALPEKDFLQGIQSNTQTGYHLMAENADYQMAQSLNKAVSNSQMAHFTLLMCANTHPLSMHNDACHLDEQVLANCSFMTQKNHKEGQSFGLFDSEDSSNQQQPNMLYDIIQQTCEQFQDL